jgi:RNA polymerase sigma-70 factor (ECF subfamily)
MDNVLPAFLAGLTAPARAAFGPPVHAAIGALLDERLADARTAWSTIAVDAAVFAGELARRLGDTASPETLEACRTADVYLAIAACNGNVEATRTISDLLGREIEFAARDTRATPDQGADVKAELHRILFTGEPERSAAMRDFAGRGDLRGYLKVLAVRQLVRAVQKGRRESPREEEALFALLAPGSDPELSILRARYHDRVESAMRVAVGKLEERSRAVLRYQLVDGWSIDRVGALYGVHRATAARWVTAAREELGTLIRAEVANQLAIPVDEVDSIVRLVQSRIDVSFERLIAT